MPQFFLNKRLIILLVSIIILVALIGFSLRDRPNQTWPEKFIRDTTGWVESLVSKPAHSVAVFFENLKDLQNTYDENKHLKKRLDDMAKLEAEVHELKKKNDELNQILDKKGSLSDYEPIQATVIGRNPYRWNELIIINKGEVNGIKKDMAVITPNGLIGKVKSVNEFTSSVQLVSSMDPKNRIAAVVQGKEEAFGLIEGYDEEKKLLLFKGIKYGVKVEKGQAVVTSGLGGVFPESLPIGKVVKVVPDQYGLTQTAYVEVGANLYDVQEVMVIKRGMVQPNPIDLENEKGGDL